MRVHLFELEAVYTRIRLGGKKKKDKKKEKKEERNITQPCFAI